jgi:hypothetical protein
MRTLRIYSGLTLLAFTGLTGALFGQPAPIALSSPNPQAFGVFGYTVAGAGDVNKDGYADVIIGALGENSSGRAYVFAGPDARLLYTLESPQGEASGQFGFSVFGAGDVNEDGYADVIVGANAEDAGANNAGRAYIFSGVDGSLLQTLTSPNPQFNGNFGFAVSGAGDVNQDSFPDFIVTAVGEPSGGVNFSGRVYVFSGANGDLLHTLESLHPKINGNFGADVSMAGDVNNDGHDDVLVGAAYEDYTAGNDGRAYIYSGANGSVLYSLVSPNTENNGSFGIAVSGAGDIDKDGHYDVIIGTDENDRFANDGRAYIFSGANGSVLDTLTSPSPRVGGRFSDAVSGAGDVNGDGTPDVIIGARDENDIGSAYVFSGADRSLLQAFASTNPQNSGGFGFAVAGAGDVNNDGAADLIVGANNENSGAGSAHVFFGKPAGDDCIDGTGLAGYFPFRGNANDAGGSGNHGTVRGATLTTGIFDDLNSAYLFDGADDDIITATLFVNPRVVSVALWFKTSTTAGGKLIGFSNSQTGSGTRYDRHLYMDNNGFIHFGVWIGSGAVVSSPSPLNDDQWHFAASSISNQGLKLFVDGAIVDTDSNVTMPQNYNGYWRIGYGRLGLWPNRPSSEHFAGKLDEVRIYHRALSDQEMLALFHRCGNPPTSVADEPSNRTQVPAVCLLEPNYPNPFNPATKIRFQLPKAAELDLVIYNLYGQSIRTLLQQKQQPAGYHTTTWDGRDDLGQSVASGVYFYRLTVRHGSQMYVDTKRMLLLK